MNLSEGNQNSNQIDFFFSNRGKHFYYDFVFNKLENRNDLCYLVYKREDNSYYI